MMSLLLSRTLPYFYFNNNNKVIKDSLFDKCFPKGNVWFIITSHLKIR